MIGRRSRRRPMGPYANYTPSEADLKELERIKTLVQNLPEGLILPGALLWDVRIQPPRGAHGRAITLQQCFLPIARGADLVHGIEASSKIGRSTFVCQEVRHWRGERKPTSTPRLVRRRYRYEYGPEDYSGIDKDITKELLPKSRRKILILTVGTFTLANSRKKGLAKRATVAAKRGDRKKIAPRSTDAVSWIVGEPTEPAGTTLPVKAPRKRAPRKKSVTAATVGLDLNATPVNGPVVLPMAAGGRKRGPLKSVAQPEIPVTLIGQKPLSDAGLEGLVVLSSNCSVTEVDGGDKAHLKVFRKYKPRISTGEPKAKTPRKPRAAKANARSLSTLVSVGDHGCFQMSSML